MGNDEKRARLLAGQPLTFPDDAPEGARIVDPAWVVDAIRNGAQIRLENAILTGPLQLETVHVSQPLVIKRSRCQEVLFSYATFSQVVQFEGSIFEGVFFAHAAHFERDLLLSGAQFRSIAELTDAVVAFGLLATDAIFQGSFVARGLRVTGNANFENTVFEEEAVFSGISVGADLILRGDKLHKSATFDRITVGANLVADQACFMADVRFAAARVGGQLNMHKSSFSGTSFFDGATVGGNAYFMEATFKQTARFLGVSIQGQAAFQHTKFDNDALFDRIQVAGELFCNRAVFSGRAAFLGSQIGWQAAFHDATFHQQAMFDGVRVGGNAYFVGAQFKGEARFLGARFGEQAAFMGTSFDQIAGFDSVQVAGLMNFAPRVERDEASGGETQIPTTFHGPVRFPGAVVTGQANFRGAVFRGPTTFDGMRISGGLVCGQATFEDEVNFRGIVEEGGADFAEAQFGSKLDLRRAKFTTLQLDLVVGAHPGQNATNRFREGSTVDLRGCVYERLNAYWGPPLDRQDPFDRQPYAQLERVLRLMARDEVADAVYYRIRILEGNRLSYRNPFRLLGDRFVRIVTGYGVRPLRMLAFLVAFPALAFLAFHFSPGAAVPEGVDSARCAYLGNPNLSESVVLSLEVYLPFDIPAPSGWEPSRCAIVVRFPSQNGVIKLLPSTLLANLTRIAGWIFIPLAAATFTGLLKYASRRE